MKTMLIALAGLTALLALTLHESSARYPLAGPLAPVPATVLGH